MKIIITEGQFSQLKTAIHEISVNDAYNKHYRDIPRDVFDKIINSNQLSNKRFLSPYTKWLLKLYKNGKLKIEDLYKATEYITIFDKVKQKLGIEQRDINKLHSLVDMYDIVKPFIDGSESVDSGRDREKKIKKEEAQKSYEDDTWLVVVPLTEEAACYYGKNTQWCTAATNSYNEFNNYNQQGRLYINIDKKNNRKYQFHFETSQFMDERDSEIDIIGFFNQPNNQKLRNFYNTILSDKVGLIDFNDLGRDEEGCYLKVHDWGDFKDAFNDSRDHINPALYLKELDDEVYNYDFDTATIADWVDSIDEENMGIILEKLKEFGYDVENKTKDEIESLIIEEFESEIDTSLQTAQEIADKGEAYEQITKAIIKHFGVSKIEYGDDNIILRLHTCPEPIVLIASDLYVSFIEGFCDINNGENRIKFNYPYYGFQGDIDVTIFNEDLTYRLNVH